MSLTFKTGWCPTGQHYEIIYHARCVSLGRPAKLNGAPEERARFELIDVKITGEPGEECDPTAAEREVAESEFETDGVYRQCLGAIARDKLVA